MAAGARCRAGRCCWRAATPGELAGRHRGRCGATWPTGPSWPQRLVVAGPTLRGVFHLAGRPRRRCLRPARPRAARPGLPGQGRRRPAAGRADRATAARCLRAVRQHRRRVRQPGPGQPCRRQRLARCVGLVPPRPRPAGPGHRLGCLGRAGAIAREGVATRFAGEGVRLMEPARAFDLMGRASPPARRRSGGCHRLAGIPPPLRGGPMRRRSSTPWPRGCASGRPRHGARAVRRPGRAIWPGFADFVLQRARAVLGAAAGETSRSRPAAERAGPRLR